KMLSRLASTLAGAGIRPCAWEEAAKGVAGGIGNGAILFSWTGQAPGIEAARRGYDVVMTPAQHAYFDMAHSDDPLDWGATWAGVTPFAATLDWDPVPVDAPEVAPRILGVQGAFWGEFTTSDAEMEPMVAPRILGLSCRAWSPRGCPEAGALAGDARAWAPV